MPPPSSHIDAYRKDVDRTLLRENLKLTPQQRFEKFHGVMKNLMALRKAGQESRAAAKQAGEIDSKSKDANT
jgi:hypothetical protein